MVGPDREYNRSIARDTLAILAHGRYRYNGETFELGASIGESVYNSFMCGRPGAFIDCMPNTTLDKAGIIEVTAEDTLSAAHRLTVATRGNAKRVGVLNFASATNPGGGFTRGAMAQEENIAIRSTLYESLKRFKSDFYQLNAKSNTNGLYTNNMIYTPRIVVFRDINLDLARPYECDIISCPAPNAGLARKNYVSWETINTAMDTRIRMILDGFISLGHTDIVLGAFGCGAFRNIPEFVVNRFNWYLNSQGYRYAFNKIIFAVKPGKNHTVFKEQLQGVSV